jgi:RNA polymerase sigma factor (sigma-70 family)
MNNSAELGLNAKSIQTLVENHRRFLGFLQPRVRTPQDAEEILQAAFVKAVETDHAIHEESVVAWFFRLLRNSLTDYYRRHGVERRALERQQLDWTEAADDQALERTVCACVNDLIATLQPDLGDLVRRVDLGGTEVAVVAAELGITPNNASVRLYRARRALKERLEQSCGTCATHGCFDCSCKSCDGV